MSSSTEPRHKDPDTCRQRKCGLRSTPARSSPDRCKPDCRRTPARSRRGAKRNSSTEPRRKDPNTRRQQKSGRGSTPAGSSPDCCKLGCRRIREHSRHDGQGRLGTIRRWCRCLSASIELIQKTRKSIRISGVTIAVVTTLEISVAIDDRAEQLILFTNSVWAPGASMTRPYLRWVVR